MAKETKAGSMALLVIAHAAADINQGAIPVLLPFFIAAHHVSYAAAAAFVFAMNLVATFAQPLFGLVVDRHSRPWLIPLAMIVIGLGVTGMALAPSYWLGFCSLLISGVGIALFHPEGARLMNHLGGSRTASAMSLFGIGGQAGFALGPLLGTAALLRWGVTGIGSLVFPTALVALVLALRLPKLVEHYDRGARRRARADAGARDRWGPFACLSTALLCRSVIFYGMNTFLPLYWIQRLGGSKALAGTALTVFLVSTMGGNLVGGRLAERFGYKAVTVAGFGLLCVLLPAFVLAESRTTATLLLIPTGMVLSIPFGSMVALGQGYLPNRIGLASGITLGVAFSFGGLTTPLLGWIADHRGLQAALWVVAAVPFACAALTSLLPGRDEDRILRV